MTDFKRSRSRFSSITCAQSSINSRIFFRSTAGTKPKWRCSTFISSLRGIPPITGVFASFSTASFVFRKCFRFLTLLRITPSMRTSGSRVLNPMTIAAALLTRLRAFKIRTTGAFRALATDAVFPTSPVGLIPSYNPLTPSITAMSEFETFIPLSKDSLI